GDLLLEAAHRRRHPAGELPVGHVRADVPDLSREKIRRRPAGEETLRFLPGDPSQLETAVRAVEAGRSRADAGDEDGPPLAFGIDPHDGTLAAARLLSRGSLPSAWTGAGGPGRS